MHIFGTNIDLNKNEAKKFRVENALDFPSVVAADKGYTFFHTGQSLPYMYDGTSWLALANASGSNGTLQTVSDSGSSTSNSLSISAGSFKTFEVINSSTGAQVTLNNAGNIQAFNATAGITGWLSSTQLQIQDTTGANDVATVLFKDKLRFDNTLFNFSLVAPTLTGSFTATFQNKTGIIAYMSVGYTVSGLPSGTVGDRDYVTDATSTTFMSTVVGGGSNTVPVFYNGSNWVIA